jgi:hypothetical protein
MTDEIQQSSSNSSEPGAFASALGQGIPDVVVPQATDSAAEGLVSAPTRVESSPMTEDEERELMRRVLNDTEILKERFAEELPVSESHVGKPENTTLGGVNAGRIPVRVSEFHEIREGIASGVGGEIPVASRVGGSFVEPIYPHDAEALSKSHNTIWAEDEGLQLQDPDNSEQTAIVRSGRIDVFRTADVTASADTDEGRIINGRPLASAFLKYDDELRSFMAGESAEIRGFKSSVALTVAGRAVKLAKDATLKPAGAA